MDWKHLDNYGYGETAVTFCRTNTQSCIPYAELTSRVYSRLLPAEYCQGNARSRHAGPRGKGGSFRMVLWSAAVVGHLNRGLSTSQEEGRRMHPFPHENLGQVWIVFVALKKGPSTKNNNILS